MKTKLLLIAAAALLLPHATEAKPAMPNFVRAGQLVCKDMAEAGKPSIRLCTIMLRETVTGCHWIATVDTTPWRIVSKHPLNEPPCR